MPISRNQGKRVYDTRRTIYNLGTLRASVKRFLRACTTLFALSADRSNSKSDFCGKGPLFLERVTNIFFAMYIIISFTLNFAKICDHATSRKFQISSALFTLRNGEVRVVITYTVLE